MSCSDVRSMLSAYVDGEVISHIAGNVKEHLARCNECRKRSQELRQTTSLLSTMPEVEPPAFLLQQIMAVTVDRPTLADKMRAVLEQMRRAPQYARVAVASGAAAALVLGGLLAVRDVRPVSEPPTQTPHTAVAEQPAPSVPEYSQPIHSPEITVTESRPRVFTPNRVQRRPVIRIARTNEPSKPKTAKIEGAPKVTVPPVLAVETPEVIPEPNLVASVETFPVPEVSESPVQKPDENVRIATAVGESRVERLSQETNAHAEVRATLAAGNRQRNYATYDGQYDVKKVTVDIISTKF